MFFEDDTWAGEAGRASGALLALGAFEDSFDFGGFWFALGIPCKVVIADIPLLPSGEDCDGAAFVPSI